MRVLGMGFDLQSFTNMARKTLWIVNEKDFEGLLGEGFDFSLLYFAVLLILHVILLFLRLFFETRDVIVAALGTVFLGISVAAATGLVLPLASHLLLKFFKGKRPMTDTFQMYYYSSTPSFLLAWLPVLNYVAPLISFGNVFRGIRTINGLSFWATLVVVLLPTIVYWGIWVLLYVFLVSLAGVA
jgi:hypothetical protein